MATEIKAGAGRYKWMVLVTVIVGTFLGRLDQTIVNLALPKIIGDFGITVSAAGWIATAYILANAVFVPVWGKLGDTIGRKRVYIFGFLIFIFGSVLAGIAWNLGSMLVFRIIQAVAASADYPTAMAILAVTFPGEKERAQALGLWSSAFAAATVFGPLIGGPLIDELGWRSIFMVNLPVGLVGLLMAWFFVEESVSEKKTAAFDWWGAIVLGASLAMLVLVLDQGYGWGWLSATSVLCYIATVFFGALFVFVERRQKEPIVDLGFFKNSLFVNTLVNNFIVFMGMMGSIFLIPIFAQGFLGYSATESGYLFIPMAAAIVIASPFGGRFVGRVQPRYIIAISTAVAAAGLFLFSSLDPRSTALDIIVPLSIMALGLGFGMPQRTSLIATAVPIEEVGAASSVLALARNVAGAFGIAVFGTLLNNATENNIIAISRNSSLGSFTPANYGNFIGLIVSKAEISAYVSVFETAAALIFLGAIAAFWIKSNVGGKPNAEIFAEP